MDLPEPARYRPPRPDAWSGRADNIGLERHYQVVECVDLRQPLPEGGGWRFGLLGFACDAGVRRNLGRPGAAAGPAALRAALGGLAIHPPAPARLWDCGDICCPEDSDDLEGAQALLGRQVARLLGAGVFPLLVGGGHEIAWGHFQGLQAAWPGQRIGVINLDAHLDLRPLLPGDRGSSGTPFRQIARACAAAGQPFDYLCLGVQPQANTASLYQAARELGATLVEAEALHADPLAWQAPVEALLARCDRVYFTLCLDTLGMDAAPGVSAPQPLGLPPAAALPLLARLARAENIASIDIAELSPPYDLQDRTAKLAASFLATLLRQIPLRPLPPPEQTPSSPGSLR